MSDKTLYERLGGYDAIVAAVDAILPRLIADERLGRFWLNRGDDGVERERQLLIDYLANASGGPMYYTGRDMKLTHVGMGIDSDDWTVFTGHVAGALESLGVGGAELTDTLGFIESLRDDIVD